MNPTLRATIGLSVPPHRGTVSLMKQRSISTQFGALCVCEDGGAITTLRWGVADWQDDSDLLREACAQLAAYAQGTREVFDLPLSVQGSAFQRDVCAAMSAIPFGDTVTYGDIGQALGVPAQAIGQACGANPIPIIIPCHRVMGAKGLTGFSGHGGVETKVALLRHERAGGFLI